MEFVMPMTVHVAATMHPGELVTTIDTQEKCKGLVAD